MTIVKLIIKSQSFTQYFQYSYYNEKCIKMKSNRYGGERMASRKDIINAKIKENRRKQFVKNISTMNVSVLLLSSAFALSKTNEFTSSMNLETTVEAKETPSSFLGKITKYATDIATKNDLYASVMIAQAALESAWGNSGLAAEHNNLFGIKGSYNGKSVQLDTLEDDGSGSYYATKEGFRKYDNWGQSLNDYASVLTGDHNPNSWRYKFYQGARVSNTSAYQDATKWLTGRYATDTTYHTKLNKIIEDYNLTQYDKVKSSVNNSQSNQQSNVEVSKSTDTYQVQAGDSVWKIANKFGMTVDQFRSLNNLSGNFIYPGQTLKVNQVSNNSVNVVKTIDKQFNNTLKGSGLQTSTTTKGNYKVNPGDSLWRIASKHGMTLEQLKALNGLTSNFIYPGQMLSVKGTSVSQPVNVTVETPKTNTSVVNTKPVISSNGSYVVQAGDSVWKIAKKFGMTLDQVAQLNGLKGYLIHPGQRLNVSGTENLVSKIEQPTVTKPVQTRPTSPVQTNTNSAIGKSSYVVQAGDSVWRIASKHGLSLDQFRRLNNLSGNFIYPGQVVKVTGQVNQAQTTAPDSTVNNSSSQVNQPVLKAAPITTVSANGQYVVKANDSLYRIAVNHGMTLQELIQANGFAGPNQLIIPGQTIVVK